MTSVPSQYTDSSYHARLIELGSVKFQLFVGEAATVELGKSGLKLWPAAKTMCRYLESELQKIAELKRSLGRPIRILELGAGLGLPSIYLYTRAVQEGIPVRILATDSSDASNQLLDANIKSNTSCLQSNNSSIGCHTLKWVSDVSAELRSAKEQVGGDFDIVMASDAVYMTRSIRPLLYTAVAALGANAGIESHGKIALAYETRALEAEDMLIQVFEDTYSMEYNWELCSNLPGVQWKSYTHCGQEKDSVGNDNDGDAASRKVMVAFHSKCQ